MSSLLPSTTYTFVICPLSGQSTEEVASIYKTATITTPLAQAPPDVTGLTTSYLSDRRIYLSWTSGGGTTSDYTLSYQTGATAPADCTSGTKVPSTNVDGDYYYLTGLTASTQYSFRVCAENANPTPDFSSGLTITATTGEAILSLNTTFSGLAGLTSPQAMDMDYGAHSLYVVGLDNKLAHFSRDRRTANSFSLTASFADDSGTSDMEAPSDVKVSPDARHVYVLGKTSNSVAVFGRETDGRTLTALSSINSSTATSLSAPVSLAIPIDGRHLYVASTTGNSIVLFERNLDTGALTYNYSVDVPTSYNSSTLSELAGVTELAFSPDGEFLYAASPTSNTIVVFSRTLSNGGLNSCGEYWNQC